MTAYVCRIVDLANLVLRQLEGRKKRSFWAARAETGRSRGYRRAEFLDRGLALTFPHLRDLSHLANVSTFIKKIYTLSNFIVK